jgi:GTP cyclohydrolase I
VSVARQQRPQTWEQVHAGVKDLAGRSTSLVGRSFDIYGIPTGGAFVAAMLGACLDAPIRTDPPTDPKRTVIVDDIVDSGATLAPYLERGYDFVALHGRPGSQLRYLHQGVIGSEVADWMVYPWEKHTSAGAGVEVVTRLLQLIGEDPTREGLRDTPERVVRSWTELYAGYRQEPPRLAAFEDGYDQMVVLRDIAVRSTCEHHMLPFIGTAHVAYIPQGRVLGLSKLARLVDYRARRLQIQERLTNEVADAIADAISPAGVGVLIEAQHFCMLARGVREAEARMVTSAVRGVLRTEPAARDEFLRLARGVRA